MTTTITHEWLMAKFHDWVQDFPPDILDPEIGVFQRRRDRLIDALGMLPDGWTLEREEMGPAHVYYRARDPQGKQRAGARFGAGRVGGSCLQRPPKEAAAQAVCLVFAATEAEALSVEPVQDEPKDQVAT